MNEETLGTCEMCEEQPATMGCGTCSSVVCEDCCCIMSEEPEAEVCCPICGAVIDKGGDEI